MSEIDRTLHPLPGLTVTFSLRPDWEKEKFRSYFIKTEASFKHATSFGTLFFPKREESPLLHDTLCQVDVALLFFREAIDLAKFKYNISGSGEDLKIHISNPCRFSDLVSNLPIPISVDKVGRFTWEYYLREKKLRRLDFTVDVRSIEATSHDWTSNGTITSLHDLLGAQLIVQLHAPGLPNSAEFSRNTIQEYRQAIDLAELIIRLQNGIVMRFDADNLQRSTVKDSLAICSFTFPKTMRDVLKATEFQRFKKLEDEYGKKD